ncbi:MAG: hypothetical protein PHV85_00480 [Desulfovibrionaceae bacterium]|nr:hypothetical protein [Desulfovibrionaceae bacterium]
MYNNNLKVYGQYLAEEQAVPQNTSADGNGAELILSGTQGAIEVLAEVVEDVVITDTKTLSIKLQHKDAGGSYADLGQVCEITASGETTKTVGDILGRFVLPTDCKDIIKTVLTTDDVAVTGKLSVYPTYLAR